VHKISYKNIVFTTCFSNGFLTAWKATLSKVAQVLMLCIFMNEGVILLVYTQISLSFIISQMFHEPKMVESETSKQYANQSKKKEKRKNST